MAQCNSCGAEIVWAVTSGKGKAMPIDAEPNPDGNVELLPPKQGTRAPVAVVHAQPPLAPEHPIHMPHHATCPQAAEWRRR